MHIKCLHPNCPVPMHREQHTCKRHWWAICEELRSEFKQCRPCDLQALKDEVVTFFEDRLIGDYEIVYCSRLIDGVQVGCGADVVWMVTRHGKNVSVNADTVEASDLQYDPKKHEFHLEHCSGQQARRHG